MIAPLSRRALTALAVTAALAAALPALALADSRPGMGILKLLEPTGAAKEIQIESFSWGAMPATGCSGRFGPGAMTIGGDFEGVHAGVPFKKATLFVRKAPTRGSDLTIELENTLVTSAAPPPAAATGARSSAVVSLGKLGRVEYTGGTWSLADCRG